MGAGTAGLLREMLGARLSPPALAWLDGAREEIARGAADERWVALLSIASRHTGRGALEPTRAERAAAAARLEGWDPERWDRLDAARVLCVLAYPRLDGPEGEQALDEAFRYADVGELVALYRSLAHLPAPERFLWRAGEGARSNMRALFEAACCDTPYPARCFDEIAWRSAVLKALFVGAPLWRLWGRDARLSEELARMALDYADERRSAGREVPPELWLALGPLGGERARDSIGQELRGESRRGRAAAALALARAGRLEQLQQAVQAEGDPWVRAIMGRALEGPVSQRDFAALEPS